MIKTDKGEYLSEFTPEMMAKVNQLTIRHPYIREWEVCEQVTGKSLRNHQQDYITANWDMSYSYKEMNDFLDSFRLADSNKEEITLNIKKIVKSSIEHGLKTNFRIDDFKFLDNWIHSKDIQDSLDDIFDLNTKKMHEKVPQTKSITFVQALEHMHQFKEGMFGLRNFISDKVMPIIMENYERKQEEEQKKRNLKAKERRQAKKQKQG